MGIMNRFVARLFLIAALSLLASFAAACTPSTTGNGDSEEMDSEMDHDDEAMDMEEEHDHEENADVVRIPNNGAVIHLISPVEGSSFETGDEIVVEIETENITVGEDGNHWHIYIDGSSWGMVMGHNMDQALRDLAPGHHEISVYLSIESHEELEDGDSVMIEIKG